MNILEIDGKPCAGGVDAPAEIVSTSQKLRVLKQRGEDFEFYPTTPEIMEAMKKDIWGYLKKHKDDYAAEWRNNKESVKIHTEYTNDSSGKEKKSESLDISSFLDIGAGDGRVLDYFEAAKKYGIEIARAQADDLIRRGVFIIGRNYWDVSLIEQRYGLVFSNPPFSCFEKWVNKILTECNFCLLYLVMPVRWKNQKEITKELERYETNVVGEFDFSNADREARGRVNLVRVNAKWIKHKAERYFVQETVEDAFKRWIHEYITDFSNMSDSNYEYDRFEGDEKNALKLKLSPIAELIEDYENEKETLRQAFSVIGKLPLEVVKMLGQDKRSMLEIIKKAIEGLKSKYWRAAFDKLEPVKTRMTRKTRDSIFDKIKEFKTLDFNSDNIYSVIIWIINNCNVGILDQIGEVFDAMTRREYIEEYKSNRHWAKGDWRHTESDWKYEKLPSRWKLGLDYRIVISIWFGSYGKYSVIDDFIVICRNLGFPIKAVCQPNYTLHQREQHFYTEDGELAFTMRFYTGNQNAHLKINKKLLMKFNIEIAKIRNWMSEPDDVAEEFDIPKEEAVKLWNSGPALIGKSDMKMLECKEAS
jgi:SAM-dependent methyltransferase